MENIVLTNARSACLNALTYKRINNLTKTTNLTNMKPIQMVDLKSQYHKIKEEIDSRVLNVIESSAYINGPAVKDFQQHLEEYLHVKHVIPCGNGTDALLVAMMALGLKPGDEVISVPFTFIATVEVIGL